MKDSKDKDSTAIVVAPKDGTPTTTSTFTVLDKAIKAKCREIETEEKTFEEKNEKRASELVPLLMQMHSLLVSPGKRTDKDAEAWTWGRWVAANKQTLNTPMRTIYRIMQREGITPPTQLSTGTKVNYNGEQAEVIHAHELSGGTDAPKVDIFIPATKETKTVKVTSVDKVKKVSLDTEAIYVDKTSGKWYTYDGAGRLTVESTQEQRDKLVEASKAKAKAATTKPKATTTKKQAEDKDKAAVAAAHTKAAKKTRRRKSPGVSFVKEPRTFCVAVCQDDDTKIAVFDEKVIDKTTKNSEGSIYNRNETGQANLHRDKLNAKYGPKVVEQTLDTTAEVI